MTNFDTVRANLEKRGFTVSVFPTAAEAADYLNAAIDGKTVGAGGSQTVAQLDLADRLAAHNTLHWHARGGSKGEAARAQVYLASANGLAETGEIVNIDGTCNRVSATLYGHEAVYLIVGRNKLAPSYDAALWRARNIAGPRNAQRLHKKTPCAVRADKCYDCASPDRICNALTVFWRRPGGIPHFEVVLVDEELGF